jgi:hypothetical protein
MLCLMPLPFIFHFSRQYRRITLNRLSLAFFLFSAMNCVVQVIMQFLLYSADSESSTLVASAVRDAMVPQQEIAWLTGNLQEFKVQLCTNIPTGKMESFCTTVFNSRQDNISVPVEFRRSVGIFAGSSTSAHC